MGVEILTLVAWLATIITAGAVIAITAGLNGMVTTTNADGTERRGKHCSVCKRGPDTGHQGAASTVRPCGGRTCRYCHIELLGVDAPYLMQVSRGSEEPLALYIAPQERESPERVEELEDELATLEEEVYELECEVEELRELSEDEAGTIEELQEQVIRRDATIADMVKQRLVLVDRACTAQQRMKNIAALLELHVDPATLISMVMNMPDLQDHTGQATLDDVV